MIIAPAIAVAIDLIANRLPTNLTSLPARPYLSHPDGRVRAIENKWIDAGKYLLSILLEYLEHERQWYCKGK